MRRVIYILVFFCLASVTVAETSVTITSPDLDVYSYKSNRKSAWDALASFTITSGKEETIVKINGNGYTGSDGNVVYNADLFCPDNAKGEGRTCFKISNFEKKEEQTLFSEYVLSLTSQKRTQLEYFCHTMANNYENLLDAIIEKSEVASNFEQPYLRGNIVGLFESERAKFENAGSICLDSLEITAKDIEHKNIEKLEAQIASLQNDRAELTKQNVELEQKLSQTVSEVAQLTELLREEIAKTETYSKKVERLENRSIEIEIIKKKLQKTQSELQISNSQIANLTTSEARITEQLNQSYDAIQLLKNDVEELVIEKAEIIKIKDAQLQSLTSEFNELQKDLEASKKKIEDQAKTIAEKKEIAEKIEPLIGLIQEEVEILQAENEVQKLLIIELENQLSAKKIEIDTLLSKLENYKSSETIVHDLQKSEQVHLAEETDEGATSRNSFNKTNIAKCLFGYKFYTEVFPQVFKTQSPIEVGFSFSEQAVSDSFFNYAPQLEKIYNEFERDPEAKAHWEELGQSFKNVIQLDSDTNRKSLQLRAFIEPLHGHCFAIIPDMKETLEDLEQKYTNQAYQNNHSNDSLKSGDPQLAAQKFKDLCLKAHEQQYSTKASRFVWTNVSAVGINEACTCHKNAFVEFVDPDRAWQAVQKIEESILEGSDYTDAFNLETVDNPIVQAQVANTVMKYFECLTASSQYHIEYKEADFWKRTLLSNVENPSTAKFKDVLIKDFCIAGAYSVLNNSGDYIPFQAFSMRRTGLGWILESTGLYTGIDSSRVTINREICKSRNVFGIEF